MRAGIVFMCISVTLVQSRGIGQEYENGKNVVTVPPNCPIGQELVNGACREIWRAQSIDQVRVADDRNVVSVPANCPSGQELINGVCREVWRHQASSVLVAETAPTETEIENEADNKSIISVPNQCPTGYKPDKNGYCREIWDS